MASGFLLAMTDNFRAILHNEIEYPDPTAFKPERFLRHCDKKLPRDPSTAAFGFGRRYAFYVLT
jgi:cytochrome P450